MLYRKMRRMRRSEIAMKKAAKPPSIKVEIPPYGRMLIVGERDDGALAFFESRWPKLWPGVKREVQRMSKRCELRITFKGLKWLADGARIEPNVFMSDKSDWYLRIDLDPLRELKDDLPFFDFFIREAEIVHCQPVF
jgi:hypothetical protein